MNLILFHWFFFLQLTVQASDQALPTDKTSTVQVIVSVPRDNSPPRFESNLYTAEITEAQPVGEVITNVVASKNSKAISVIGGQI